MNIQISVMIWTLICFAVLVLVLKKFLFTPMLSMMDQRNSKIEQAQLRKETIRKNEEEAAAEFIRRREALMEERKVTAAVILKQAQAESEDAIQACKSDEEKRLNAIREELQNEHQKLSLSLDRDVSRLAELFASEFVS